jgi:hypothetical protein
MAAHLPEVRSMAQQLLIVDYGEGAFGPTILLQLGGEPGVVVLDSLFESLSRGEPGACVQLQDQPSVSMKGLAALELGVVASEPEDHISWRGGFPIRWSCTADEWAALREFLEPFLAGYPGHQYLTSEGRDSALVEASFMESV